MKYAKELSTALRLCRAAGKLQLDFFGRPLKKTPKKGLDFATNVDYACEKLIVDGLLRAFDYGVLSEEMGELLSASRYRWLVDPLDGTLHYARGLDDFGVLISLQKDDDIVLGVMHRPLARETWHAIRGRGAFCNNRRVRVSKTAALSDAALALGNVQYALTACPSGLRGLLSNVGLKTGMPWQAGFTRVVDGRLDLQLGAAHHVWDFAPAKILMEEAGGVFSDFEGNRTLYKKPGCLSGNARLNKEALSFLSEGE